MTRTKQGARRGRNRGGPYGGRPAGPFGPHGMRRGPMGMMGRPQGGNKQGPPMTHYAFDPVVVEPHFGKADPPSNETALNDALLKKSQQLTPTTLEQGSVQNLVSKMESVLEGLILSPTGLNIPVEEMRAVGSFKKGTMLAGHPVADLVIILKETPGAADIENLANKVQEKLKEATPSEDFPTQANEGGFNTTSSERALVRVLVTTLPKNLFEVDTQKHVDSKLLEGALATIRHARWFEESASHTTIRFLIRLLKDLKKRFAGLAGLTPWLIDLLAFKSATGPNGSNLPITAAFRRALQLLAAGCFLPGSVGILDPCESGQVRAHSVLGLEEQDLLCMTSQTLLRTLSHGAYNEILGGDGAVSTSLDTDITSWGGTIVTPGEPAYNKEAHKKESELLEKMNEETSGEQKKAGENK
ncbi:interleukin enhancer-binding factor 2 homolog [Clytia hemisphaerica]|uniref:DZF domain-containing protein n=1 Tax=Clytia hemisphaerica TaxID=252671 RepID=A0A7M5X9U7_9CNID